MEGRSDDQSMQIMIEQMGPKRIAFVHGNETAVAALSTSLSTPIEIYMTKQNETISMKSDTKTYSIKMDDSCKWCTVFLLCGFVLRVIALRSDNCPEHCFVFRFVSLPARRHVLFSVVV